MSCAGDKAALVSRITENDGLHGEKAVAEYKNFSWAARWVPRRSHRQWSCEELQRLKLMAGEGIPVVAIARALRRSTYSIRNKALDHGISLTTGGSVRAVSRGENSV